MPQKDFFRSGSPGFGEKGFEGHSMGKFGQIGKIFRKITILIQCSGILGGDLDRPPSLRNSVGGGRVTNWAARKERFLNHQSSKKKCLINIKSQAFGGGPACPHAKPGPFK